MNSSSASLPPSPYTSPPLTGESLLCHHCGSENRKEANFCWVCGVNLSGKSGGVVPKRPMSAASIVLLVLLLPLAAIGGLVVTLFVICLISIR